MDKQTQLQNDLKHYGILNADNTFSEKLSSEDVVKFYQGHIIVADNDNMRLTFQLTDNNTNLKVNAFKREKELSQILKDSQDTIQYSEMKNLFHSEKELGFEKKAFVFDENKNQVIEYDLVKNNKELTQIIAERKNADETNRYKEELLKLKDFLQDKIDKYPEIAKYINNDLNIVSKTINTIDDATPNEEQKKKQEKSDIQLGVNDPDLYQDANEDREEEQERKRGFRR